MKSRTTAMLLSAVASVLLAAPAVPRNVSLLNASYDPTRELYQDFNASAASSISST